MNDPHVVALVYKIKNRRSIDYRGEELLNDDEKDFFIHVKDDQVRFAMKTHYANVEEAREAVREYIERWEFDFALEKGPGKFSLEFDIPEIVDRNPSPGVIEFIGSGGIGTAALSIIRKHYPPPPRRDFKITYDVKSMYERFIGYHSDREPLPSMTYFCLTMLEKSAGVLHKRAARRQAVAKKFRIEQAVLDKIGDLSSEKGGQQGRKANAIAHDLTSSETRFLEKAMVVMIRRAAEVAHDPDKRRDTIKLSDLPDLV